MTRRRRNARFALTGFVLVSLLVFGSLAWASWVSLRSQRAEQVALQRERHRTDLALALRRMEARVQSTLTRETSRSPYEYSPLYYPPLLWDNTGLPIEAGQYSVVSPLVDQPLEEWLLLHFQVSPDQEWTSPQVPSDDLVALVGVDLPPKAVIDRAAIVLSTLKQSVSPRELGERLAEGRARDLANAPWSAPEDALAAAAAQPGAAGSQSPGRQAPAQQAETSEYQRRQRQTLETRQQSRAPEACDPSELAASNLLLPEPVWPGEDQIGTLCVTPSDVTPVWLDLVGLDGPFLAFVRTVPIEIPGVFVYQGFLVDWPLLRSALLEDIADLFPDADLAPVHDGPVDDLDTLMTWLPARLVTQHSVTTPSLAAWSPRHSGLLLAWLAAATVLAAVGLGVRSLLALAERRTQFAYAVSHELRTPLTTFRLYTDMLTTGLVPAESRDDYLKTLNEESQRLAQLVEGVLEYSRLEHHSANIAIIQTTVGALLAQAEERFGQQCTERDHHLIVDANGLADRACRTDPELTLQILGILVDNACKYAAGADDPRIIVSAADDRAGRFRIAVRDFGPGVPPNEQRAIFRPFSRGRSSADASGIGLGLALARRWAQLLGGRLELVSPGDRQPGACFQLVINP